MSFLVNFRSAEGKLGYHPAESLEEAVRFVEHLRNQEHVLDARIWRLQEVPLEVKTYYKVEVAAAETAAPKAKAKVEEEPAKSEAVLTGAGSGAGVGAGVGASAAAGAGPVAESALGAAGAGPNGARFGRFNRT